MKAKDGNPKSEARNPKEARNPNCEQARDRRVVRVRNSEFGIRISTAVLLTFPIPLIWLALARAKPQRGFITKPRVAAPRLPWVGGEELTLPQRGCVIRGQA